jgi:hypothetical protein
MGLSRPVTGLLYLYLYMKTQELHWKEIAIQNLRIEDSGGDVTADHRQVLKIWDNYITEQYD